MKSSRHPAAVRALLTPLLALVLVLALTACEAPVGARQVGFEQVYKSARANVIDNGRISWSSRSLLAYFALEDLYAKDPDEAIARLTEIANREALRTPYVAIAELHYELALRRRSRGHFLAAAIHAYYYLFGEGFDLEANPYSAHFRFACDLYNRGLAQGLSSSGGDVRIEDQVVDTPCGRVSIVAVRSGFPWGPESFPTFLPADAFEPRGLRERIRVQGLGVPLIALQTEAGADALSAARMGRNVKLPATAFLRLHGSIEELKSRQLHATLELYLSSDFPRVEVEGKWVPLETDLTTPLAFTLQKSRLWDFEIKGMLRGSDKEFRPGVYMLQPYQRGKIPLVLIHGTASSPATWAQTVNGVMLDPRLATRYQVWLGLYNTGNPILYSAADIRESLRELVERVDPLRTDPELSRMVLIGHSQGGIVARLLVSRCDEDMWRQVTDIPFEEAPLTKQHREMIRRCIFFEPLSFVERVVFISTPHRGSYVAGGWIGALTRSLISLPFDVIRTAEGGIARGDLPRELWNIPTSIENMSPNSRFVKNLQRMEISKHALLHSIIAVKNTDAPLEKGEDGVVKYVSASLDGVESEFVVRHSHSCQGEPETISELRRILFEHIGVRRERAIR